MKSPRVTDLHVRHNVPLPAPALLSFEQPRSQAQAALIADSRRRIEAILDGRDSRFLVIVGPCSIHDHDAGIEYGRKLAKLREDLKDHLEIVMRVYFEKPRTSIGWKGLIMDADLDGSADLPKGLRLARRVLRDIVDLGLPTATEFLDPITPQYLSDLISWAAIGARTVESQTHRQMASGLSMPVGFKNTTTGELLPVVHALQAAAAPQTFFGIGPEGVASMVSTTGNPHAHMVLRGGASGPNCSPEAVADAIAILHQGGVRPSLMIDASHANCGKDHRRMPEVFQSILQQRRSGTTEIIGAMLESNLVAGNQKLQNGREGLTYGQSITDPCIDWDTTESLLRAAAPW